MRLNCAHKRCIQAASALFKGVGAHAHSAHCSKPLLRATNSLCVCVFSSLCVRLLTAKDLLMSNCEAGELLHTQFSSSSKQNNSIKQVELQFSSQRITFGVSGSEVSAERERETIAE